MRSTYLRSSAFIGGCILLAAVGCTHDDSTSTDIQDDQAAALKDPFNYGPNAAQMTKGVGQDDQLDRTNISGGGVGNYDKKAMKRDWDSVLNP